MSVVSEAGGGPPSPDASRHDGSADRYQLDPARFPQRLDLELDPAVLERLQALADRSGRSISEMAAELLGRLIGDTIA